MSESSPPHDRRTEIESAFRRLPILDSALPRLPAMVDWLDRLPNDISVLPAFNDNTTLRSTLAEIAEIEQSARKLARMVNELRGNAIDALASCGFNRGAAQTQLLHIADSACRAKTLDIPDNESRGRRQKVIVAVVADVLAIDYEILTGYRATLGTKWDTGVAYGPFFDLVVRVFEVLGLDGSPESAARSAIRSMKKKDPPNGLFTPLA